MKIYYDGVLAAQESYGRGTIKTQADWNDYIQVHEQDDQGNWTITTDTTASFEWELADINYIAGKKITSVYPEYKQLNIIRNGTDDEQATMQTYIDAVRAWANSTDPDPWDGSLDAITP